MGDLKDAMNLCHALYDAIDHKASHIPYVDEEEVANDFMKLSPRALLQIAERAEDLDAPIEQEDIELVADAEHTAGPEEEVKPEAEKERKQDQMDQLRKLLISLGPKEKRMIITALEKQLEG